MIATMVWISWLALLRDKVAFTLTFVLPSLFFLAFAAIFSNAPGHDIKLKLVVADLARTATTERLTAALERARTLRVIPLEHGTVADVADLVRRGTGDAGLVIASDLTLRTAVSPLTVLEAPDRPLAASMALGQVQRAVAESLPDVLLARILDDLQATKAIDVDDRSFIDKAFAHKAEEQAKEPLAFTKLGRIEPLPTSASGDRNGNVLQYAAAVSAIFLLFGAVQGAYALIDERENGIADRLRLAAGGMLGVLTGRLLFLVAQGTVQVALIYLTALIIYGASFSSRLLPFWLMAVFASSAGCAGLALLACVLSRTRRQAELWTTFAVLLLSALGGSMVPRYIMPTWLQTTSWWTPNAWIIHALGQSVLPGNAPGALVLSLVVLLLIALVAFTVALVFVTDHLSRAGLLERRRARRVRERL